jgi:hypothetical protein
MTSSPKQAPCNYDCQGLQNSEILRVVVMWRAARYHEPWAWRRAACLGDATEETATASALELGEQVVKASWTVMAHVQKTEFFFRRNGRVHLNRRGRHFSWLLSAEVCASAVVMLHKPCSEVVRRVLATNSVRQFPLYIPSRASPCVITFQLDSTCSLTAA